MHLFNDNISRQGAGVFFTGPWVTSRVKGRESSTVYVTLDFLKDALSRKIRAEKKHLPYMVGGESSWNHETHGSRIESVQKSPNTNTNLVGGFNPFEKYARQNWFIFPKDRGEHSKNLWVATAQRSKMKNFLPDSASSLGSPQQIFSVPSNDPCCLGRCAWVDKYIIHISTFQKPWVLKRPSSGNPFFSGDGWTNPYQCTQWEMPIQPHIMGIYGL